MQHQPTALTARSAMASAVGRSAGGSAQRRFRKPLLDARRNAGNARQVKGKELLSFTQSIASIAQDKPVVPNKKLDIDRPPVKY
jgi:hypothetical protein